MAAQLESRRVLGERLFVIPPGRVAVQVSATVLVESGSSLEIRDAVEASLLSRLSDRKISPDVEPWPLGRPVAVGELESLIATVDGVRAAIDVMVARVGQEPGGDPVTIAPDEIAILAPDCLTLHIAWGRA
jgi:hypothetical protein